MQVIDNIALLAGVGGGEGNEDSKEAKDKVTCKIGIPESYCEGSTEAWGALISAGLDWVQDKGGALGIWIYDLQHSGEPAAR